MNPLILAQEIIDGRRITRKDDLSFFLTCDLDELCEGADPVSYTHLNGVNKGKRDCEMEQIQKITSQFGL